MARGIFPAVLSLPACSGFLPASAPALIPNPSPWNRGGPGKCTWKTSCPAARPLANHRFTASHRNPLRRSAAATFRAVSRMGPELSFGRSSRYAAWDFGITSVCPRIIGRMSMNAIVVSSSKTMLAGASLLTILQKMQSGTETGTEWASLLRSRSEGVVRNDQFLDLVRALVQAEDAGIAIVPFHIEISAEPVPAVDLDRPVCHPLGHLRPKQLRHGHLERIVETEVPHLGRSESEEPGCIDLQSGLSNHLADQLEVSDRPAEGLPLFHVLHGGL